MRFTRLRSLLVWILCALRDVGIALVLLLTASTISAAIDRRRARR